MSGMTDARALDVLRVVTNRAMQGSETREAYDHIAARLRVEAERIPSYEALLIIVQSVCGSLERAGLTDCDDPGEAIDVMRERLEAALSSTAAPDVDRRRPCDLRAAEAVAILLGQGWTLRDEKWEQPIAAPAPVAAPQRDPSTRRPEWTGMGWKPALVAGDAVAALPAKWREEGGTMESEGDEGYILMNLVADDLEAALAQDRASQAGAAVDTSTNEAWIARAESKLAAEREVGDVG